MPSEDACQPQVEVALKKEGWVIVDTQVYISKGDFYVFIDIEAANEANQTFIEVKCFPTPAQGEFYNAVGQYVSYREVISTERPGHSLYLAIPEKVYDAFTDVHRDILRANRVKLVIVNLDFEVVVRWIQ